MSRGLPKWKLLECDRKDGWEKYFEIVQVALPNGATMKGLQARTDLNEKSLVLLPSNFFTLDYDVPHVFQYEDKFNPIWRVNEISKDAKGFYNSEFLFYEGEHFWCALTHIPAGADIHAFYYIEIEDNKRKGYEVKPRGSPRSILDPDWWTNTRGWPTRRQINKDKMIADACREGNRSARMNKRKVQETPVAPAREVIDLTGED